MATNEAPVVSDMSNMIHFAWGLFCYFCKNLCRPCELPWRESR